MKVLLIEDDAMIGENIQIALDGEGISVDWVRDGIAGEAALGAKVYDALLLDIGLPKKNGTEILRSLRAQGNFLPVLMITARDTISERVAGLNNGADDYLIKPFDLEELIARLHALLRRTQGKAEPVYQLGEVEINPKTRQALVSSEQVILSAREWSILDALLARPGAILSRAQLEERLYGWAGDVESNTVEVYIHGLRKKLGQQFIINVRGVGYMVEKI